MKRLFLRTAMPTVVVVLGVIAYAHAQLGTDNRYSSTINVSADNSSPLRRSSAQSNGQAYSGNPLRENLVRVGQSGDNSSVRNPINDSRIKRVAAESPATDSGRPSSDFFGSSAQNAGASNNGMPQMLPTDSVPDAAALDPPQGYANQMNNNSDQQRYPQLVGPNLNQPTGERYATGNNSADRRSSGGHEPAPFKSDPFTEPTAISQNPMRGRERNAASIGGNYSDGIAGVEGIGQPGAKQLEGSQCPQVTIQKFVPNEIQVGKPAIFRVTIRNTGSISAGQVEIRDQVPRGTKLMGTTPRASQGSRGEVVWNIGTLRPGEESSVEMQLMPTIEGEIGSVATVHFGADASAKTVSTRPQLVVETNAQKKVLIGEQVMLSITVSNPGTGVATGVAIENRIPQGLQHPAGAELEYEIGDLRPGESKKVDLPLAAVAPGKAVNVLIAHADGNLKAEDRLEFEVVAPKLEVAMEGPKRRYLEREAVYQVALSNPGTAPAKQVELVAYLPQGLKFVSANNAGHYDEANRAVYWRLEELPCNEVGSVELVTMPIAAGQQNIKLRGSAEKGLAVEKEQPVQVEGIASIIFQPIDITGPIEVGGETTYEVRVTNQGSKSAGNVRLSVDLPSEMQPLAAEGPTRYAIEGNRIVFDGLAQLAPKADTNYRIKAKGIRPGDLRVKFKLVTDEMKSPVTKEESTRVFADE